VRVVSGRFERDMTATNPRTGKSMRLSNAAKLFGRDRTTIEEAYPGDVVGIVGNAGFVIGDTLTEDRQIVYDEITSFAPECFAYLENPAPADYKRFREGVSQLLQEGVVQSYELLDGTRRAPLLGAVGPLQFEIVQYRLQSEYGAASRLEGAPWTGMRWLDPATPAEGLVMSGGTQQAVDGLGRRVVLFADSWSMRYFTERNPKVALSDVPFKGGEAAVAR
jgi:peptide chain release factor 3